MQKGNINVTSENIFPIIKKFLYSDQEIFLRELISNAVDATQKLRALANVGEFKGELGDSTIVVKVDEKKKTLTVSDHGIGMTIEEIEKYINQIAFSSAEEFLEKYKNNISEIIGHFGLGFYSSFMVSKKVEIVTKSYTEGSKAIRWSCEGSPDYEIVDAKRKDFGTDIILHIDDESKEYIGEERIRGLLKKYCKFLPVEIGFGLEKEYKDGKMVETGKYNIINNTKPAWTIKPADLKEEDYDKFYKDLYPTGEKPLFNIHLNVDYPFNLTGILYFPKLKNNIEIQKNKIQLYCNQVFVTDSVEGIVPEFLTLLHGVLDSPDIPLNVSRSYLQSDQNVKKISSHITKKVADRLHDIFKNQRDELEKKWDDLRMFIEYGILADEKFYEKAEKFFLVKNTDGKYFTFEEYKTLVEANQTDQYKNAVFLYATNKEAQYSYIEEAKTKGYDVLIFDGQLDVHFINHIEPKLKKVSFRRVDAEIIDKLIEKDEKLASNLTENQETDLRQVFLSQLPKEKNFGVIFEGMKENDVPAVITQSEFMRRMKDMSTLGGGAMGYFGEIPESYNLTINSNHPIVKKILSEEEQNLGKDIEIIRNEIVPLVAERDKISENQKDKKEEEIKQEDKDKLEEINSQVEKLNTRKKEVLVNYGKENKLVKQLIDLALLSKNMLVGEDLSKFVKRSVELIG